MSEWVKLDAIASRVQMMLSGGLVTDEGRVDFDLVKDSIHAARNAHLADMLRRRLSIPAQYFQRICCLGIECVDIACGDLVAGKEMQVAIPPVFGQFGKQSIRTVSDVLGKHVFTRVDSLDSKAVPPFVRNYGSGGKYMLRGEDLLVLGNLPTQGMEFLCVELLTTDPVHPLILECDKTGNYPVPKDELEAIELRAYNRYREMVGIPVDLTNDANPTT